MSVSVSINSFLKFYITLKFMVKSALQKNKATSFKSQELYLKKSSQILFNENFSPTKCVITSKIYKLLQKIVHTYADLSLLKIYTKFLGKATREKQFRGKKRHLCTNKLSFNFFSFKFPPLIYKVSKEIVVNYRNNERQKQTWTILIMKICYKPNFKAQ